MDIKQILEEIKKSNLDSIKQLQDLIESIKNNPNLAYQEKNEIIGTIEKIKMGIHRTYQKSIDNVLITDKEYNKAIEEYDNVFKRARQEHQNNVQ